MRNLLMMISLLLVSLPLSAQSAPPPMQSPQSHAKPGETTVIPEGTHLLMQLLSPLDTESAVKGSELYLETIFPVVREDHVSIPIHTRVQGSVEAEKRAGHFDRTAKFRMHFTTLVLANGYTVP